MENINTNYQRWMKSALVSKEDKEILSKMSKEQIDDAFFKDVEFGTAGMRGVLGPGTNRLNYFTVKKATVGFAVYLLEKYPNVKKNGVVISHDNRYFSRDFTLQSAKTLSEFGIKVYIFDSLRPTPELSFAVRYLGCDGGIMITASHNPKEYNGYKVYDETGCQLVPDKIERLVEIIGELPNELDVTYVPVAKVGEIITLGKDVDDEYVRLVEKIQVNPNLDKSKFKIVFTPNHGTSYVNAMRIFKDCGYNVVPVLSQIEPDPAFSGTLSPNPEDDRSFIEPIKVAQDVDADLIVMTDPDGDRVGLGYKDKNGKYQTLTGNQSAPMLMEYMFSQKKERGLLSEDGVIYNTVVTSSLGEQVASYWGIKTESFLTGFKYIGNRIDYYEKLGNGPKFEFGYEESYGCLIEPFARDKDGCQAILLYSEMALYYFNQGKTLDVVLDELGEKYGYHADPVFNMMFEGSVGSKKMAALMDELHKNPLNELNGIKVSKIEDYELRVSKINGKETPITLPQSNLVKLFFEDGSTIAVRPSGTEPKVKFYVGAIDKNDDKAKAKANLLLESLKTKLGL